MPWCGEELLSIVLGPMVDPSVPASDAASLWVQAGLALAPCKAQADAGKSVAQIASMVGGPSLLCSPGLSPAPGLPLPPSLQEDPVEQ